MRLTRYTKPYINVMMIIRVLGWLLFIESFFMLIPLVTAFIYGEEEYSSFLWGIGISVAAGLSMTLLRPRSRDMGKRDAILLTSSVWVVFSLFGTIPFIFSGVHSSFTNAFFESMSGFTTTGLSIFPSLDGIPHSILIWRCVMQWIGGLGIILFTLAVLPTLNSQGGIQLFNAEVTGITHDKLRPRVSSTAKGLWMVYIVLTIALIGFLLPSEMDIFDAVCYGLSTMSTGGFAINDAGIGQWDSVYIKIVFTVFMFMGGVNFGLLFQAAHGHMKPLRLNDALKWYFRMLVTAAAVLAACIIYTGNAQSLADVTVTPLFQAVSLISSTGLTEPGFNLWGPLAQFVFLCLIFIGACAGSTSGGAKVDRLIVVLRNMRNEFFRIMHPNAVVTVRVNGKGTSSGLVQKAVNFFLLYIFVIIISGLLLVCMGLPLADSFFSVLEAISNAGLGVNIEGVPTDYNAYPEAGKYLLTLVMLAGRLELYTVLLLFTSVYWKK